MAAGKEGPEELRGPWKGRFPTLLKTTPPNDGAASNSWHQHFVLRKASKHVGLMLLFLRNKEEN